MRVFHQTRNPGCVSQIWDDVHTAAAVRTARCHAARWARRHGRTGADRDDLVQDILVNALERGARFDPGRGAWTTFVSLLARHVVAERRHADLQRAGMVTLDLEGLDDRAALHSATLPSPSDDAIACLHRLTLHDLFEVLPEEPRDTLALLVLTEGDIAAACRASGRSSSSFYRAVTDLRFWLRAAGLAPSARCAGKNRGVDR